MNHPRAHQLIERYFAGETSLEEERALKAYFGGDKVAAELVQYTPLFAYWAREAAISAPPRKGTARRRPLYYYLMAVAAVGLLVLAVWFVDRWQQPDISTFPVAERQPVDWSRHEITDEKEALRFLKTVLSSTSDQLREGPAITVRELREVREILD